jgi:hypothetical protein
VHGSNRFFERDILSLGGFAMPHYLSPWENGDFSVVQAWNKGQAAERLDEVANAEGLPLHVLSDFLVHFKLTDEGEIELEEFGEEFEHLLD